MVPRLQDLREDHDLTQTQVAKLLNMSQTGYSKYETGENDVPTQVLLQLADYYHTSVDYLLGRTDEPRPYPSRKKRESGEANKKGKFAGFLTNWSLILWRSCARIKTGRRAEFCHWAKGEIQND